MRKRERVFDIPLYFPLEGNWEEQPFGSQDHSVPQQLAAKVAQPIEDICEEPHAHQQSSENVIVPVYCFRLLSNITGYWHVGPEVGDDLLRGHQASPCQSHYCDLVHINY